MSDTICTYNNVEFKRIVEFIPKSSLIDYGRITSVAYLEYSKKVYISTNTRVAFYWDLVNFKQSLGSNGNLHIVRVVNTDLWIIVDGDALDKQRAELTATGKLRTLVLENANGVRIFEPVDKNPHHKAENAFDPNGGRLNVAAPIFKPSHKPGNPVMEGDMGSYSYYFKDLVVGKQPHPRGQTPSIIHVD